ncbi:hypothetical protein M8990_01640 [Pasteurella multocida]|uniref:hypothetical protein n=1 Tax=Pasteurella multocida TaxID=747 RepID=UPI0020213598|nr:hypothetical protein [Pasteurella multocida]MCL7798875.1 hypothetical protein [Pasteurella multocida]MCL7805068.1 hypothetical protein [Pasteurella multocida]MCL7808326.1 hypothetical protein [Pasteurella multocida]
MKNIKTSNIDKDAQSLAIIYTFPPYVDTSGNVFSKRIHEEIKDKITIITNKFISSPPMDDSLNELTSPYVTKRLEMQATFTYREWKYFNDFIEQAYNAYLNEIKEGKIFRNLYSRSMSVITHLVAYKIKTHNPNIKWIAEFSDPILKEVDGNERNVEIPLSWLEDNLSLENIKAFDNNQNLFFISELLVYLYADEIIFTNKIQKEFMLSYLKEKHFDINQNHLLLKSISSRIKIKQHPTLPIEFYQKGRIKVDINKENINLGYFGNFNIKRGISEFINAWKNLPKSKKTKLRLFIFTNMNSDKIYASIPEELISYIKVEKSLKYLDYLGILDSFDYVLSFDTQVSKIFGLNPYLPSKISDYLGANTKTLALLEKNSPTDLISNSKLVKQYIDNINLNTLF